MISTLLTKQMKHYLMPNSVPPKLFCDGPHFEISIPIVGSKSGVLWPLNCNHFLTPVLVSQDPIKKNERGYPSRFFWLFEILAILEVVTSSDTHVPLFRNILVRTWGCRISLDSEWWEEAENVYVDISRYWKSRYKCENASNERAR